jgi:release factor glutamine methyltransferase
VAFPSTGPAAPRSALDLVRAWTPRLEAAGIDTARLDAELLVASVLGVDRDRLFLDDPQLTGDQLFEAERRLTRRAQERVPVAYLTGVRWFDGHQLEVSDAVLVPRPDTELLVELAAQLAPLRAQTIDVGTGSGAIAIALSQRRPDLRLTASDIDEHALAVARRNIERIAGVAGEGIAPGPGRIALQHASLLGDWTGEVVVSNPPYVETTLQGKLAPELAHEPPHALYAGDDGMSVIRPLVRSIAAAHVGLVLLEHGWEQGPAVRAELEQAGYRATSERDLAGHERVTWALRSDLWPLPKEQLDALRRRRN